jgi:signal transduction histidine kinase
MADARALESVLTNLVQNSVIHGHATEVDVAVRHAGGRVGVVLTDNGCGFQGDQAQLGKLFVRHARSSGSGVGLYIVRQLAKAMKGGINFRNGEAGGFVAEVDLPGTHAAGVPPEGQLAESTSTHDQHARGVRTL